MTIKMGPIESIVRSTLHNSKGGPTTHLKRHIGKRMQRKNLKVQKKD